MKQYRTWSAEVAAQVIAPHVSQEGALLPILHDLHETFGSIFEATVTMMAQALNLTRAEMHGVVSFFHDFRREPAGRHVLKLSGGSLPVLRQRDAGRASLPPA